MSRNLLPVLVVALIPLASGGNEPPESTSANRFDIRFLGGLTPAARQGTHTVKLNGHTFTLPDGFTIELAAAPPLADRPIVTALDDKGRLYVCDSSGSNEKVAEQVVKKPHRIVRLEDTNNDGKYDKSVVYVSNVMFPEGAMWLNGSLYVAAPPHIWKFTDANDDGKAEKEEVWFDGKTLTGCANDLHGPYLGPDGWVYWCKGAFAKQEYTLANGKKFNTRAAHIFRAKPDGTNIEPVMTGGMDNPVDVVFTPGGERIFSTTFFQHPRDGRRDGLVHAVYGAVYGKDHDPVYEHPWTSPQLMPPMTHMGPAAPCGLHRYESDQFGKDYENNVFCCQFNLRKVSRHVLVPSGSTFVTQDSDFVVSDNIDFHPTDVIEDADGSLLVIDTGGWYKLCCPTSQLVKPDVTGAIYRVKRVGAHKVDDPRGLQIGDWKEGDIGAVAALLDDPRPAVRWRAVEWLAARGPKAVKALNGFPNWAGGTTPTATWHALHALTRIDHPDARKAVREVYLDYRDPAVRLAAIHAVGLWRDRDAILPLAARLRRGNEAESRAAAESLGRIGDPRAAIAMLSTLANEKNDRVLDHSLTYALIEIGDRDSLTVGLKHPSTRVRRATLAALDQMPNGSLDAKVVIAELGSNDPALAETAWWVAGHHPEWGEQLVGYFREQLGLADQMTPPERAVLADRLVKFAKVEAVQRAVGAAAAGGPKATRVIALRVMARSGLKQMPDDWAKAMVVAAGTGDLELTREALAAVRAVPLPAGSYNLLGVAVFGTGNRVPDDIRLSFLAVAPAGFALADPDFRFTLTKLGPSEPPPIRAAAADVLTRRGLSAVQLTDTAVSLKLAGPIEVAKLLPAFEKSKDEKVGLALVQALSDPKVRATVRIEQVKPILDKYPPPVRNEAEKLYALLAESRKDERAKLEKLIASLPAGDIRRGQLVFNGTKAQCAACHKIGYVGGLVGPDLTRIGGVRTERDLLEAIVLPSASFVRSYEPVRVTTIDDRTLTGILKKDAPDEIILVVAADKEERIARADVATIDPAAVSVMPAGLDQQLTPQELADLVAFLKACK